MVRRRFTHPFWNSVRDKAIRKVIELRRQNFFATAMLPMSEPEYTGATRLLKQPRFAQQPAPALGYPAADPVAGPLSPRLPFHG